MSLTSISTIRKHLYRLNLNESDIRNYPIRLSADSYTGLPHEHIVSSSEIVKAIENSIPTQEQVTLNNEAVPLSFPQLAVGTVVCANDTSLSILYQENIDYTMNYTGGAIRRIEGGGISSGSEVSVWYLFYQKYKKTIDYSIDYNRGRLRRITNGAIEETQELLIDYQLGETEFSDDEIEQCITEAEAEIKLLIDSSYHESIDPVLQTASTYLSLSLLCRNSAGISQAGTTGTGKNAVSWLELAASYRDTAMRLLSWFRPESPWLNSPISI